MAIAGFRLRVNGGVFSGTEIDVGLVYEYLLDDLAPGTSYSVEIQSYDEIGIESAWSAAVVAMTASPTMLVNSDGDALVDSDNNAIIIYA